MESAPYKPVYLFAYLRGTLVVSKVLGDFLVPSETVRVSTLIFTKDGVAVFHFKVLGEVLSKLNQNFQKTLYSNNDLSIKGEKDNLQIF